MTSIEQTTLRLADFYYTAHQCVRSCLDDLSHIKEPPTSGEYQEAVVALRRAEANEDAARKALLSHAGGGS